MNERRDINGEYYKLSCPVGRKCGFCYKEIKEGDLVYQVPTDNNWRGFEYAHKVCFEDARPLLKMI